MKRGCPVVLSKKSLRWFWIVVSTVTVGVGVGVFRCVNSIKWEVKPDGILLNRVRWYPTVSGFEGCSL